MVTESGGIRVWGDPNRSSKFEDVGVETTTTESQRFDKLTTCCNSSQSKGGLRRIPWT
jgi:hypothetical protein